MTFRVMTNALLVIVLTIAARWTPFFNPIEATPRNIAWPGVIFAGLLILLIASLKDEDLPS